MKSLILSALLLFCSCAGFRDVPADGGLRQQLIEMFAAVGDAAIRLEGTKLLREKAPDLLPLIDRPTPVEGGAPLPPDGMVSLAEIVSFVQNADPATIVVLGAIYFRD